MFLYSPLEQFIVFSFFEWSNFSFIFLGLLLVLFIINSYINKISVNSVNNVYNIISGHIEWWYPEMKHISTNVFIIITIWFFILFVNVLGMIPYNATLTAQFILVLSITLPTFIGINLLGIYIHGFNIFYLILPTGVPLLLTPFISILELFAYFIRVLSLTLRLAANLISGHILMKIVLSAFMSMPLFSFLIIPLIILELIVAFLQAYVFTVLVLSYYQDILLPH